MTGGPEPDFWGLLRVLIDHAVDFVLIGGFAVGLHGYVRATKDIDIVPSPDRDNLARLWEALSSLDAKPAELVDFRPEELPAFSLQGIVEGAGNWALFTRLGRLDVMQYVEDEEGELSYPELRDAAVSEELPEAGGRLWFASLDHLISMKQRAGRDLDLIDVTALRRAHGLEDD